MPTPSTSQVSLASQNGPMEATITDCSRRVGRGHQHAHAEVVAVEHHVDEHGDAHEGEEDERQEVHATSAPFPAMCVSTTM